MNAKDIADRNDQIRRSGLFGPDEQNPLIITPGVAQLGDDALGFLVLDFMHYDDFDPADDPSGHHDFGVLNVSDTTVWFKLDRVGEDPDARIVTFCLPSEF